MEEKHELNGNRDFSFNEKYDLNEIKKIMEKRRI